MPTDAAPVRLEAILDIYRRVKAEVGYDAIRFVSMVVA